jgi:hypothetical protein
MSRLVPPTVGVVPVFVGGDGKPRNALLLADGFYFEVGLQTFPHLPQRCDPSRQTEPLKACSRFLPCLSMPARQSRLFLFMALPFFCGFDTPSLQVQGGQRRSPAGHFLRRHGRNSILQSTGTHTVSPAARKRGSTLRSKARITGPMRRRSISQRRVPGSHWPPARRMSVS